MPKSKPKATVTAADGAGGMVKVQDRRFDARGWPNQVKVRTEQADSWLRYFYAECERRGWGTSGISQLEARENSGSITVNADGVGQRQLAVVWERKRGKSIDVRARSIGADEFPLADIDELLERVNTRCRSQAMERLYVRGQLVYEGLPWRGEIWLDDTLRLGPPSRQDETALLGPRVILVDALVECVGRGDSSHAFDKYLRELSVFLSVVMRTAVQVPEQGRVWTFTSTDGAVDCAVRYLGYWEQENPQDMPPRGACGSVPLRTVSRPDFALHGIDGSIDEEWLPADVTDLWAAFRALSADRRRQFLQAAAKWQEALKLWRDSGTLSFALMVVACEALKPAEAQFRDHNIYHVVEALLGEPNAKRLQEQWFRPQDVRNAHLHHGEFRGSEFAHVAIASSFQDPTFDEALRELARITPEAIIAWLWRRGSFTMPLIVRQKTVQRCPVLDLGVNS